LEHGTLRADLRLRCPNLDSWDHIHDQNYVITWAITRTITRTIARARLHGEILLTRAGDPAHAGDHEAITRVITRCDDCTEENNVARKSPCIFSTFAKNEMGRSWVSTTPCQVHNHENRHGILFVPCPVVCVFADRTDQNHQTSQ
jgi:hypothetical protein